MTGMSEEKKPAAQATSGFKRNVLWLAAGIVAVGILSLTAAYAPPVFKRLIVFHAVFGVACGVVLLWLASEIHPSWKKFLPYAGAGLCLLGILHMGWLSYQQFYRAHTEYAEAHPRGAAMQDMLEKISEKDPTIRTRYEEEQRRLHPWFRDYLAHRVKNIGEWTSPWPEVFWLGELLLACILCWGTMRSRS